jgi:hypothetical protein
MKMENELRKTRAAQIDIGSGTSSPTLTFRIPNDNDGNGTVLNSTGQIEWSNTITYARNGANQITRTVSDGPTTIIANNVTNLLFTRPAIPPNLLQIDMVVQKTTVMKRTMSDQGQIKIKMRN